MPGTRRSTPPDGPHRRSCGGAWTAAGCRGFPFRTARPPTPTRWASTNGSLPCNGSSPTAAPRRRESAGAAPGHFRDSRSAGVPRRAGHMAPAPSTSPRNMACPLHEQAAQWAGRLLPVDRGQAPTVLEKVLLDNAHDASARSPPLLRTADGTRPLTAAVPAPGLSGCQPRGNGYSAGRPPAAVAAWRASRSHVWAAPGVAGVVSWAVRCQ